MPGDKFDVVRWMETPLDFGNEDLRNIIDRLVEQERRRKKTAKQEFESRKEEWLTALGQQKAMPEMAQIESAKKLLHAYQESVNADAGWNWARLRLNIEKALGAKVRIVQVWEDLMCITNAQGGTLHVVVFNQLRYVEMQPASAAKGTNAVFTRYGTGSGKEYVHDARGIPTRRFVSRACNVWQMEQLMTKGVILPRNTSSTFGAQADVFDLRKATGNVPPRANTATAAGPSAPTSLQDLDFLQVRDGSGPHQRALSATAVIDSSKVIRGNKGERFDEGHEFVGVIIIDLAKMPPMHFRNQYVDAAHPHKVAYARFDPKDTGSAASTNTAAAPVTAASPAAAAASVPAASAISGAAAAGAGSGGAAAVRKIKRTAQQEMEEYIYSVQKNREVLLASVPIAAVYAVLPVGRTEWLPGGMAAGYYTPKRLAELHARAKQGQVAQSRL